MPDPNRDYLTLALNQYWFAPPVALWRAIELRVLAAETFPRPLLDLGCGDGLIAQVLFAGEAPVEAGFDPWSSQVCKAPASGAYRFVQQARGDAMPYPDASFDAVFSNSVLEHIPQLDPVLREVTRVLRPGGRFLATVPSDVFRRLLAGYRERDAKGDRTGAEAYAVAVDQRLEHHRYLTPTQWARRLELAGMHLLYTRYYIPSEVEALWDRANATYGIHPNDALFDGKPYYRWLASPRLRKLGYQKLVRRWIVRTLGQRWRRAYTQDVLEGGFGGGLLVVGEKA
ncbi:MAG: class I SAM-dependent methyltransferase [Anaerolineae bacterium]|nr:class I SAM-dependent methyltransferase [Anaerolineae bacterium]